MSLFGANVERCRKGAAACVLNAKNAHSVFEKGAWLDLAKEWATLAEAFEQADRPGWLH